jgi:dTDP-4-amino-4,6-dideoxygalactose transaminase
MIPYLDLQILHEKLEKDLHAALAQVIASGWYIQGKACEAFEQEWAAYCEVEFSVGCGNGLDALRLVLEAWKIQGKVKAGDKVLVPSNTYIATWLAVTQAGLTPVPVEPDLNSCLVNARQFESALTNGVKILLPVYLYGRIPDMDEIMRLAADRNLWVLSDAAQAHGAVWKQKKAGSWAHAEAFSFYPGKNLGALGDGGAVCSNDPELIRLVKALGNYGSEKKYHNLYQGINSRLDELQAAMLRVKLPLLDAWNEERHQGATRYLSGISNPYIRLPLSAGQGESVWHIFQVQTPYRQQLQEFLRKKGISTMIHYPVPPHLQPAYAREFAGRHFPVSEQIHAQTLSLPLYPGLSQEKIQTVIDAVNAFIPGENT